MSNEDELDRVFKALANRVRREICDALKLRPLTTKQLCTCFPALDRTTVMMHLRVLERAGLVVAVRKGRERFNHLDAMPIQAIHERWIGPHAAAAAAGLHRFKFGLEADGEGAGAKAGKKESHGQA
ncbi:ArsR/SmtB family transcription factor [Pelagerythrobacter marensis]|uniref:Putative transcriptional regulator, ArsR family n=1 Tax=Pelagerythrobacter marensis TaxID=543877 RepID=A0A0G3X9Y6_9SPHN|nr:winged helix-turn-helix domain-containing protein [Pelagerythrobacter marensis]AKM07446.1 Putative transcriptional regulator, ArsR family [Pelagerythrobacter marensis]